METGFSETWVKFVAALIFIFFYVALFSLAANVGAYKEAQRYGSKARAAELYTSAVIAVIILVFVTGYSLVEQLSKQ